MSSLFNVFLLIAFVISSVQSCNWQEARDCMRNDPTMQDLKDCGSPEEFFDKFGNVKLCDVVHNLYPCVKNMEKECFNAMPEGLRKALLSLLDEEFKNTLTDDESCAVMDMMTQSAGPLFECVESVKQKEEYQKAEKYEKFILQTLENAYEPICCALSKLSKCDQKDKLMEDCDEMSQTILRSIDEIGKKVIKGFCETIDSEMDMCQQYLAEIE